MGRSDSASSKGAVAALVVATAPSADFAARALLWRPVAGRPLIAWPLRTLATLDDLGFCGLVAPLARLDDGLKVIHDEAPSEYCQFMAAPDNTWRGALAELCDTPIFSEWIIIIDATLPLVTAESLRTGLRAAARTGVAIAGEPVKETLKRVDGNVVVETPPRDTLRRLLSPIIFQREALQRVLDAYEPSRDDANDLVALARLSGAPLTVYDAGYPGVRGATDADLAIIEMLLRQRRSENHPS